MIIIFTASKFFFNHTPISDGLLLVYLGTILAHPTGSWVAESVWAVIESFKRLLSSCYKIRQPSAST